MTIHDLQSLYQYNAWANSQFYGALEGLEAARLTKPIESSFPSLLDTFAHIVAAEWVWLERWNGRNPGSFPDWLERPRLQDLRARLSEIELSRAELLRRLTEAELESEVTYRTLSGLPFTDRLLDLLLHVVNHSSYHRGQLTTMLRQMGATPVASDYVLFLRLLRKA